MQPIDESDLRLAAVGTTIARSSAPFPPLPCRFSLPFPVEYFLFTAIDSITIVLIIS
ncbi:hypothetical protein BDV24DRAFT_108731 [Aspergillus arachidicola]|uniref:Uncharacterized protein n=1 Tax=Aspergillus arachidicola TaxID=656916 RepID=A0A5N6YJQ6_9EURO|nr:hypothetical protein BDV24DRAFT_108731 [Aspergillus arachidicola]